MKIACVVCGVVALATPASKSQKGLFKPQLRAASKIDFSRNFNPEDAAPVFIGQKYGEVEPVKSMSPRSRRESKKKLLSSAKCDFPLDIVIVQDATSSFAQFFVEMRDSELENMYKAISSSHPGSRYGLVSFKDKPLGSLGFVTDYCQRYDVKLSPEYADLYAGYGTLFSNGGADEPENSFGAIIAASQHPEMGWSSVDSNRVRMVVVATDAWPHYADDGYNIYGLAPFSGNVGTDEALQCTTQDYPSPAQVKASLDSIQAYSAFVIFETGDVGNMTTKSWEWFNAYLGQTPGFVDAAKPGSTRFWDTLSRLLTELEVVECGPAARTTTTTTTVATTSSSATPTVVPKAELLTSVPAEASPSNCGCGKSNDCQCPEVRIELQHKPLELHLDVQYNPEG